MIVWKVFRRIRKYGRDNVCMPKLWIRLVLVCHKERPAHFATATMSPNLSVGNVMLVCSYVIHVDTPSGIGQQYRPTASSTGHMLSILMDVTCSLDQIHIYKCHPNQGFWSFSCISRIPFVFGHWKMINEINVISKVSMWFITWLICPFWMDYFVNPKHVRSCEVLQYRLSIPALNVPADWEWYTTERPFSRHWCNHTPLMSHLNIDFIRSYMGH